MSPSTVFKFETINKCPFLIIERKLIFYNAESHKVGNKVNPGERLKIDDES